MIQMSINKNNLFESPSQINNQMQKQIDIKLLERIRIQLSPCSRKVREEVAFLLCTYEQKTGKCLEVAVRRMLQIEYLAVYMSQLYGGHIIPVIDLNNIFIIEQKSQPELLSKIAQYLNDLIKNPHCNRDQKLYQFIFAQHIEFPNIQKYDKVLSDAANLSRRYLNTFFTRKQYGEVQAEDKDMLEIYQNFKNFATTYRAIKEIILVSSRQQNYLQQIFSVFRQINGGIGQGPPPIEFVPQRMQKRFLKIQKLIYQGEQAYNRWEVLRETVRELQCNIYKGMREEHDYYKQKMRQLKNWTYQLMTDMKELNMRGGQITADHSKYFYNCKKQQAGPFGSQKIPNLISSDSESEEDQKEKSPQLSHYRATSQLKNLLPRVRQQKVKRKMSQI